MNPIVVSAVETAQLGGIGMKSFLGFTIALLGAATCHAENFFDSNGTKIRYTVSGKGEPVVLVHGFLSSSEEWTSPPPFLPRSEQRKFQTIAATLAKQYFVIAADCRGHGRSGKPTDANQYGLEMVNDIVRLLDHLKVRKTHLVGYSMGAFLSVKLVETHPDRVQSVVLGGSGALLEGSEQLAFMESLGRSLESGRGVEPLILAMTPPGAPQPTPQQIKQHNKMFLANQDEASLAKVALGHKQLTVSKEKLKVNNVPALLIVGGKDPQKASVELTNKLMRNSKLVVLPGLDHLSTETSPDFRKHIQRFLKQNRSTNNQEPKENRSGGL